MRMRPRLRLSLAVGVVGVLLAACGGASGDTSAGGAASAGSPTVAITSPADGSDVTVPFTLEFTTSVPIGPTDTGRDHVHIFTDKDVGNYTVVTSPRFTIKDLPTGAHTVGVTLQHADHSSAGASAQITVNVTKPGGVGATPRPTEGGDGGGYGGGY